MKKKFESRSPDDDGRLNRHDSDDARSAPSRGLSNASHDSSGAGLEPADSHQPAARASAASLTEPRCKECGCQTGGSAYCYQHAPYTITPLKDGSYYRYRNGHRAHVSFEPPEAHERITELEAEFARLTRERDELHAEGARLAKQLPGQDCGCHTCEIHVSDYETMAEYALSVAAALAQQTAQIETLTTYTSHLSDCAVWFWPSHHGITFSSQQINPRQVCTCGLAYQLAAITGGQRPK